MGVVAGGERSADGGWQKNCRQKNKAREQQPFSRVPIFDLVSERHFFAGHLFAIPVFRVRATHVME
jgi:hypothetical protein